MEVHDGREEEIRGIRLEPLYVSVCTYYKSRRQRTKSERTGLGGAF
jgi:hypothetical protein